MWRLEARARSSENKLIARLRPSVVIALFSRGTIDQVRKIN